MKKTITAIIAIILAVQPQALALRPAAAKLETSRGPELVGALSDEERIEAVIEDLRVGVEEDDLQGASKLIFRLADKYMKSPDSGTKVLLGKFLSGLANAAIRHYDIYGQMMGSLYKAITFGKFQRLYDFLKEIYVDLVRKFKGNEQVLAILEPIENLMRKFGDAHKTRQFGNMVDISPQAFVEQYLNAVDDNSRIELLRGRYPMPGVEIEVKSTAGFLMTKSVAVLHRIDEQHYIIEVVGGYDLERAYLILHEFLHIWHKQKGLTFEYEAKDKDIATYLWSLRNLVADYIVEKEIHGVFGNEFYYVVGGIRDNNLIEHASGSVETNSIKILMLAITCKCATVFYPDLRNSVSQRLVGQGIKWGD